MVKKSIWYWFFNHSGFIFFMVLMHLKVVCPHCCHLYLVISRMYSDIYRRLASFQLSSPFPVSFQPLSSPFCYYIAYNTNTGITFLQITNLKIAYLSLWHRKHTAIYTHFCMCSAWREPGGNLKQTLESFQKQTCTKIQQLKCNYTTETQLWIKRVVAIN